MTNTRSGKPFKAVVKSTAADLARTNSSSSKLSGVFTQNDSMALDYLNVIIGFGLCRAWIVLCLLAPISTNTNSILSSVFLAFGALSALVISSLAKCFTINRNIRIILFRVTGGLLIISAIIMPPAIIWSIDALVACGIIIGGLGAGLLQVLWGDQFSQHNLRFATIVSPAAACLTAILVALSVIGASSETILYTSPISFFILPLLSFSMLIFQAYRSLAKNPSSDSEAASDEAQANVRDSTQDDTHDKTLNNISNTPSSTPSGTQTKPMTALWNKRCKQAKENPGQKLNTQFIKLLLSIMTFSILCRLFDKLPHSGQDPFSMFGGSPVFSLVVVGSAFLVFALVFKRQYNPAFIYRLSLPIMVAGFVAIALFYEQQVSLSILLINVGYEFFDILTWVLFTDIAIRQRIHAFRVFGHGVVFIFVGMALGNIAGDLMGAMISTGSLQITVVALLCTFSLAVIAFLIMPEGTINQLASAVNLEKGKRNKGLSQEDAQNINSNIDVADDNRNSISPTNKSKAATFDGTANQVDPLELNCGFVAKHYKLTPRESEILLLLAHGRTAIIIARDLTISSGTARTHCERIYRKLSIHKQQELIDLVETYRPQN